LGYHDHPPFIAWSIFLGYAVFKSELGVRLLMVLFHLITLRLLEHLISPKFPLLFLALVFSIPVFQFSGFWAVPDTPFLFTLTIFLLAIKHFHKKSNACL
jgi:4-amino-4-deoxy-L-arabinose transferase-like glycosyltransferase